MTIESIPKPSAPTIIHGVEDPKPTNIRIKERETCPKCDKPAARMSSPYCAEHFDQSPKDAGAREWWIVKDPARGLRPYNSSFETMGTPEDLRYAHVIEYTAYEKLERDLLQADKIIYTERTKVSQLEQELNETKIRFGNAIRELTAAETAAARIFSDAGKFTEERDKLATRIKELEEELSNGDYIGPKWPK